MDGPDRKNVTPDCLWVVDYLLTIRAANDLDGPAILASSDPDVLRAVIEILVHKLAPDADRRPVLRLQRELDDEDRST